MEEKEFSLRQATNEVSGNGYLKDINLAYTTTDNNVVIKGTITMAVDEKVGYKLKVYCAKKNRDGSESTTYSYYDGLLQNVGAINSMVNILKSNPEMSAESALAMSRRLFVRGSINPYEYLDDKDVLKMNLDIKATYIGDAREDIKFEPGLKYKCEVFIDAIKAEKDEEDKETGRGILVTSLPLYGNDIARVDMVVPAEYKNDVANLYKVGDTARVYGKFSTSITVEEGEDPAKTLAFGVAPEKTVTTKSKTELVIIGGDSPYGTQNENSYKKEDIEAARVAKFEKLQKNKEEYAARKEKEGDGEQPAPVTVKTGFKFA